jgi:hypothetical protein
MTNTVNIVLSPNFPYQEREEEQHQQKHHQILSMVRRKREKGSTRDNQKLLVTNLATRDKSQWIVGQSLLSTLTMPGCN